MTQQSHKRYYRFGETTVVVHVDGRGNVTMPLEQLSAVLALLGCVEVPA